MLCNAEDGAASVPQRGNGGLRVAFAVYVLYKISVTIKPIIVHSCLIPSETSGVVLALAVMNCLCEYVPCLTYATLRIAAAGSSAV